MWGWNYAKSAGLEFRHILMYFLGVQSQRFSESQIFFFVFSTLRIFLSTFFGYQPYLSKFVYHMQKKLRKSMKSKAFMTKIKIPANYFGIDLKCRYIRERFGRRSASSERSGGSRLYHQRRKIVLDA